MDLQKKLEEIEIKKSLLQASKNKLDKSFYEDFRLRFTYNSNAIEGNTLSLQETKVVLEGITIGGKTLREHFEVINHQEAIFFIEELVRKKVAISEQIIREIHYLVLKNINDKEAGKYRSCNVLISGAQHIPPESYVISQEMEKLIDLYRNEWGKKNAVIRASRLHIFLVKIHPFIDGNGRTSRLLMNLELLKNNYPAISIKNTQRVQYYQALDEAHCRENYELFDNLVADCILDEYERQMFLLNLE
ncbi:MAG: Fic family protein [Cardiobacteriaceae bacterium]|nr:Fic family protein [Cardiobacteriaceae bacterium]